MSTAGDTDSVFSDAETGTGDDQRRRKRERDSSVTEIITAYEKRQRQGSGKSAKGKSPKTKGGMSAEMLEFMKEIIESTIQATMGEHFSNFTKTLEAKLESQNKSICILEGELFEKANKIEKLEHELDFVRRDITALHDQVEDMERHERGVNLILTCKKFGPRRVGEDIKAMAVRVLNEHFPHIPLSARDLTTSHRLSRDNVVICAFFDRSLRNRLYAERMRLRKVATPPDQRLYLSESLTRRNRELYSELLTMKSKGRIWSVFTHNGFPGYKMTQQSAPVRVTSEKQVRDLWKRLQEQRRTAVRADPAAVPGAGAAPAGGQLAPGARHLRPSADAAAGPPPGPHREAAAGPSAPPATRKSVEQRERSTAVRPSRPPRPVSGQENDATTSDGVPSQVAAGGEQIPTSAYPVPSASRSACVPAEGNVTDPPRSSVL